MHRASKRASASPRWAFFASVALLLVAVSGAAHAQAAPLTIPQALLDLARFPATYINNYELTAATAKTVTAPDLAGNAIPLLAVIAPKCSYLWYCSGSGCTAIVPSADVTDGSGMGLNPPALLMRQGQVIKIISDTDCKVSVEFWYWREP